MYRGFAEASLQTLAIVTCELYGSSRLERNCCVLVGASRLHLYMGIGSLVMIGSGLDAVHYRVFIFCFFLHEISGFNALVYFRYNLKETRFIAKCLITDVMKL